MAHYIYSKAPDRALLSPDWRVKDETSLAILRTPLIRSWRPREASNGFHIYENEPAFIPGKTTNEKSSKKEYDRRANRAIEERRSIRVGNLLSKTTNQDVHDFFIKAGYAVEHIEMRTDLTTGVNKLYCFVALTTKDLADGALRNLHGAEILGRPIRVEPRRPGLSRREANSRSAEPNSNDKFHVDTALQRQKRTDAVDICGYEAKRLFVLDLPVLSSYYGFDKKIRELFRGFEVNYVHKVENGKTDPYVYVDFCSPEEARHAKFAKDGANAWGRAVRIQYLRPCAARIVDTPQLGPRARAAKPSRESRHLGSNVYEILGSFVEA